MKHDFKVTIFLLTLFFTAQVVGLFLLSNSLSIEKYYNETTGKEEIKVNYSEIVTGRPDIEGASTFTYVLVSILFGTVLLLFLIKMRMHRVWKAWFYIAVSLTIAIALGVVVDPTIALGIAFVLAFLKIKWPNIYTHNLSEILMYAGIAVMLVPLFDVFWMILMLIAISLYDAYAVWKSKHMIKLAEFQADSKVFAGLLIPYAPSEKNSKTKIHSEIPKGLKTEETKSAILGGGDIAFPLLFAGTVMDSLIKTGVMKHVAFFQVMFIPLFSGIALFLLLTKGQKDKFYPAMPFISLGCFVGYAIVLIL